MELWIRSQDREKLQRIDWIVYQDTKYNDGDCEKGHYLCGGNDYNNEILGEYETKERALEVLDEIQNILKPKTLITDCGNPIECSDGGFVYLNQKTKLEYSEVGTYVYEMPKE